MRHLRTFTINIHQQLGGYRGIYTGLWEKMPCSDTHGCDKGISTFVISSNWSFSGTISGIFPIATFDDTGEYHYTHDGSMVLPYMVTWIPSIYPSHVSINIPAPAGSYNDIVILPISFVFFPIRQGLASISATGISQLAMVGWCPTLLNTSSMGDRLDRYVAL